MTTQEKLSAKYNLTDTNLKEKIIADFKKTHKVLQEGNDVDGYVILSNEEYEAKINSWADNIIAELEFERSIVLEAQTKAQLLERLGITADEAKLLLA